MNETKQQQQITPPPSLLRWKAFPSVRTPIGARGQNSEGKFFQGKTPKKWNVVSTSKKKKVHLSFLPSPIDRIRFGINRRAEALGVNTCLQKSFEANQSFPRISKRPTRRYELDLETPMKKKLDSMDKIRVDGSNGLRFNLRRVKGCFTPAIGSPFNASLITSASECLMRVPKSGINPNKAVFTMDSRTSQILIVNNNACQLLGYSSRELCNMQFSDLLTNRNKSHVCALAEGQLNSEDGTMVLLSGKVVEMNTKSNNKVAVSLWIRQIDQDGRCLAVAEPVERRICQFVIDRNGYIISASHESLMLFQFETQEQVVGMDISAIIPAIILPDADNSVITKHVRKQKATGKTGDGISFPLCLLISHNDPETDTTDSGLSNPSSNLFLITVWVFQNLSGLIVIDEFGMIESCNHHFSMLMFGYAQTKILNQHITKMIPNFGQELEYLGLTRSRNATESSLDNESITETDPIVVDKNFERMERDNRPAVRPVSETIRHSIDFTKKFGSGDDSLPGSENNIGKLLTARNMTDKTNFIRSGIPGEQQTNLLKSVSADILVRENVENNRNAANVKNKSFSVAERRHSMMINEVIERHANRQSNINDDLLTPVNDTNNPYCISENLTPLEQEYQSMDIAAGLATQESFGSLSAELGSDRFPTTPNCSNMPKPDLEQCAPITSTPDIRATSAIANLSPKIVSYTDGRYKGEAIHSDGNVIDILYTISSQILPCGRKAFCVWICRDPDTVYDLDDDIRHQNLTLTFNSITSTIENSLGQAIKNTAALNCSRPNSVSLMSQWEDEEQINGDFCKYYTTLRQIGKGAYGYVKMAYRNSDHLLVVAKFILKDKLCPQLMILTEEKKEIPMEIYLLTTVKHPNIVTVYDVFENEKFFQLIMEKHGCGMDLFEFIDRRPMIDEKLGSFIFRQIANAVSYLHSLNILHRDIKDENIIIDQNFHVKLIDFGSATFMEEGKLFSTFFGTTEYCSPEVLAGNKYAGPELEMWSLGVTLYVLMFFENPFLDIEETLRTDLIMPHKVSTNLENLLYAMLDKNPRSRCTMRQLMSDPWINQEINPSVFDFAWTIPCDPLEANPEKYFSEQPLYSSATGLSTTSPQDSLSLVDEDSMIDGEEVDEDDDEEDEKISVQSQEAQICDKCDKPSPVQDVESLPLLMNTTTIDSEQSALNRRNGQRIAQQQQPMETATGKTVILMKQLNQSQADVTQTTTKNYINTSDNYLIVDSKKIATNSATNEIQNPNKNINKNAQPSNNSKSPEQTNHHNFEQQHNLTQIRAISPRNSILKLTTAKRSLTKTNSKMCSSQSETNMSINTLGDGIGSVPSPSKSTTDFRNNDDDSSAYINLSCSKAQSSYNKNKFESSNNLLLKADNSQLILSKSENNICEKKIHEKLAIYDVVSLNDLNADDPFPNCTLTDLSKATKLLDNIQNIDGTLDLKFITSDDFKE